MDFLNDNKRLAFLEGQIGGEWRKRRMAPLPGIHPTVYELASGNSEEIAQAARSLGLRVEYSLGRLSCTGEALEAAMNPKPQQQQQQGTTFNWLETETLMHALQEWVKDNGINSSIRGKNFITGEDGEIYDLGGLTPFVRNFIIDYRMETTLMGVLLTPTAEALAEHLAEWKRQFSFWARGQIDIMEPGHQQFLLQAREGEQQFADLCKAIAYCALVEILPHHINPEAGRPYEPRDLPELTAHAIVRTR